jgi:hypothetical protein
MKSQIYCFTGGLLVFSLSACSALIDGNKINLEAKNYAYSCIQSICSSWKEDALRKEASPALVKLLDSDPATTKKLFTLCSKKLGNLQSFDMPELKGLNDTIELDGEHVRVNLTAKAKFKNGEGTIMEIVDKHNNEWKLDNFHINSADLF